MIITAAQLRAARGLLDWTRSELAKASGLSPETIKNIEHGIYTPQEATIKSILDTFAQNDVEFTENDGVRRAPMGIEIFEGRERFETFMNYMYEYLDHFGGDVCVYIQDESLLQRTRKNIEAHRAKMFALVQSGKIKGRILAAKGVDKSDWAEIRRLPFVPDMPQVSFHTFGDNLALISFDHQKPPYVVLHKSGPFAAVYRSAFDAAWEKAKEPK